MMKEGPAMNLFNAAKGTVGPHEIERSPASAEKDEAIAIARRILNSGGNVSVTEARVLSRQLLRSLALPS